METARGLEPQEHYVSDAFNKAKDSLDAPAEHALLTDEEERELAILIEAGIQAERILAQSAEAEGNDDDFINDMERAKLLRSRRLGIEAKEVFIHCNQRLVMSMASHYRNIDHLEYSDLVQEGNLGLMRAVEKFDYRKGFAFSTYASWWIQQRIDRIIKTQSQDISLPYKFADKIKLVNMAETDLRIDGEVPNPENIANRSGLDIKAVKKVLINRKKVVVSLDQPINADGSATLSDKYYSEEHLEDEVITQILHEEKMAKLQTALAQLTDAERDVLARRYRLNGQEEIESLLAIAESYGLSKHKISNIQKLAEEKLRQLMLNQE